MNISLSDCKTLNQKYGKIVISIDISAKTLDICIKKSNDYSFEVIENDFKIIRIFFKNIQKMQFDIVVSMENTGRYYLNLYQILEDFNFKVFVLNPSHLKKSLGLIRGKNDKIDARRICNFTHKNEKDLILWKPCLEVIMKIKMLFSERNSKIKLKSSLLEQRVLYSQLEKMNLDSKLMKMNKKEVKIWKNILLFLRLRLRN